MSRKLNLYLTDILTSISNIQSDATELTYEQLLQDRRTKDAITHNLFIIGESTKQIPQSIREKYSYIPWQQIAGMRDMIAHAYFNLNPRIIWNVIQQDLEPLKTCIEQMQQNDSLE